MLVKSIKKLLIANHYSPYCLFTNISDSKKYTLISLFEERKLLYQSTSKLLGEQNFEGKILQANGISASDKSKKLSIYCGYDPTASSLHLGNLVSIIMMARIQLLLGIRPIFLLGGATGQIGDPSGKKSQRALLQQQQISHNLKNIHKQISDVYHNIFNNLSKNAKQVYNLTISTDIPTKTNAIFVNNLQFYADMNILDFLRKVGKHLPMSSLLSKQHISSRLNTQSSISYTQFTYSLLQAYDFYKLHQNYSCLMQIGGSDQWGNIVNGCTLVRKMTNQQISSTDVEKQAYGITMPLLLTKTGEKFGKSQGNALFLDEKITPVNDIYDYLFNTPDEDIQKLLYIFTFYSQKKIEQIIKEHSQSPQKRIPQRILAENVVNYLTNHFKNYKQQLLKITEQQLKKKNLIELETYFEQLPGELKCKYSKNIGSIKTLPDLLHKYGIVGSRNQGRRQIDGGGIYINNAKIPKSYATQDITQIINASLLLDKFLLIKKGKKKCFFVKFQ